MRYFHSKILYRRDISLLFIFIVNDSSPTLPRSFLFPNFIIFVIRVVRNIVIFLLLFLFLLTLIPLSILVFLSSLSFNPRKSPTSFLNFLIITNNKPISLVIIPSDSNLNIPLILKYLLTSHPSIPHLGLLPFCIQLFPTSNLVLNSLLSKFLHRLRIPLWLKLLDRPPLPLYPLPNLFCHKPFMCPRRSRYRHHFHPCVDPFGDTEESGCLL